MSDRYIDRPRPHSSDLGSVIDTILDKGLVIDIYVRIRVVGIELITIDARIIVASVDTYLRLAEAAARLEKKYGHNIIGPLAGAEKGQSLGEFVGETVGSVTEGATRGGAKGKTEGAIEGVKNAVSRK